MQTPVCMFNCAQWFHTTFEHKQKHLTIHSGGFYVLCLVLMLLEFGFGQRLRNKWTLGVENTCREEKKVLWVPLWMPKPIVRQRIVEARWKQSAGTQEVTYSNILETNELFWWRNDVAASNLSHKHCSELILGNRQSCHAKQICMTRRWNLSAELRNRVCVLKIE